MIVSLFRFVMVAAVALAALLTGAHSGTVSARTQSIAPADHDLVYRRYRGDDEVTDHDRGRGRGRGRGHGSDDESKDSSHKGDSSNSGHGSSGSGNSGTSGANHDSDEDDRFGK